ncbi:MAG: hypothetical protein V1873_04370 [Verrucomicrobiota bacterium]
MTSPAGRSPDETTADEISGLTLLKEIWNIQDQAPRREPAPNKVSSDIYNMPATSSRFPHRSRPSR